MSLLVLTLALLPPQGLDDPAPLHPAGSALYLDVPDVPSAIEAYQRTALFETLRDPEIQKLAGSVVGLEQLDPFALLESEYRKAVERGELPPIWEVVIEPLQSLSLSLSSPEGPLMPTILALIGGQASEEQLFEAIGAQLMLEMRDVAAADALRSMLLALLPEEPEISQITGATVYHFPSSNGRVSLVQDANRCVFLAGANTPEEYVGRARGELTGLRVEVPEPWQGTGDTVFRFQSTVQEELWSLEDGVSFRSPFALAGPALELAEGLVGPLVSMLGRGGNWRMGIDEKGRVITEGLSRRGMLPLDDVLASRPLDPAALDLIHPDAIVGWAVHFDPEPLLALIEEALGAQAGGPGGRSAPNPMEMLDEQYGFRPDRDLLAPLGSALAYSLPEPKTLLAAPPLMVSAALSDRQAFQKGMDGLSVFVRDETRGDFEISRSEYRGMRLYSLEIDWDAVGLPADIPIDPSAFFKLTMAVCDERVFVTTLPSHAKREIRRILSQSGVEPVREFPEGCTSVGFADWFTFIGKLYTSARAIAPIMGEDLPFDPALLPPAARITGRFAESLRWKRHHGDEWVLHYQESSIGPEIAIVLGVAVLAGQMRMVDTEGELVAVESGYASSERVAQAARNYQAVHGKWPTVHDLVTPAEEGGEPWLNPLFLVDPWGNAIQLKELEGGRLQVWSAGLNGIDEGGGGDDIVVGQ